MKVLNATKIIKEQMTLGEGPLWNSFSKKLSFVDIEEKRVYEYNPKTLELTYKAVTDRVGCIVPFKNNDILACVTNKLFLLKNETQEQKAIYDFNLKDGLRFNDGKCDKYGRLLVGTMAIDQSLSFAIDCGTLYSYEYKKEPKVLLSGLAIPNGLAFSKDNKSFYHIDTVSQSIMEYNYDLENGAISNGAKLIEFPLGYGSPDGMCIDENDNIWVALWGGYKVACVDTKLKKVVTEVNVDAKYVSCCCFGGENLDELFITTAKDESENGGQVFHIKLNVKGTLPYKFKMEE